MKSQSWSSTAIADSVQAVGNALSRLITLPTTDGRGAPTWAAQFSEVSLDEHDARSRVNALYRGATVRL